MNGPQESIFSKYDPWRPIAAFLREHNNADLMFTVIDYAGVPIQWPQNAATHKERVRNAMPIIHATYSALPDEQKGVFAQIVAKNIVRMIKGAYPHEIVQLRAGLNDIGWNITDDGQLETQDALLSEQFFPFGTQFDAYQTIKSIFSRAKKSLYIVDGYVGGVLFQTLGSIQIVPHMRIITSTRVPQDFYHEAHLFRTQYNWVNLEIRSANDFHDRFVVIDHNEYYHIGASIKDAGKKAFLISRLEDQPVIILLDQHIDATWNRAAPQFKHP
jgi:hypothetical protein